MGVLQKIMTTVARYAPDKPVDPLIQGHGYIGRPMDRVDGEIKVRGAATFSAEYHLDGIAHAAMVHSSIPAGEIAAIDTAAAEAAPGVLLVLTHENAPTSKAPTTFNEGGDGSSGAKVLQDAKVRWNGQPIAVVVAETLDQAEHAAGLVTATYRETDARLAFDVLLPEAKRPPNIMGEPPKIEIGDAEQALAEAAFKVDRDFATPRHNHNAIEPHATIAHWEEEDRLTLYDASQYVSGLRDTLAGMFALKADRVRVLSPFVGGGFGGKGAMWLHVPLAVMAAKAAKRPVKLVVTRRGVFHEVGGRTPTRQRVAIGATTDGTFTSIIHTGTTATVAENEFPEQFNFPARHLYAAKTMLLDQHFVNLNSVPNTFMRAPGESIGTFAQESVIDELAEAIGMCPIELRRRNEPAVDPSTGNPFSSRVLTEMYAKGAEAFGWNHQPPRSQRDGRWLIGQGVATCYYPGYRFPSSARIRIEADGGAIVQTAAHEMGMGTATVQIQHAADRLGLTLDRVTFEYGDSSLPMSPVAGGSNQTASIAAAVRATADALHAQLLKLASGQGSPLRGASVEETELRDGGLYRKGTGEGLTYAEIVAFADEDHIEVEAKAGPPIEGQKYSIGSTGAQFCEVRVHEATGETRVSRWLSAIDCGRVLNPKTATSQVRGGVIMGIGAALMEETVFDERTGRIVTSSLADYHVPVQLDVPPIEVIFSDVPDPHMPLGVRGVGEIGITGCMAAIANAVYNATGKRIRELPITLDKLM